MSSTQTLDLSTWAAVAFTVFITIYCYKAYTHPLANIPGPLLAKFTNARFLYHSWKGDLHLDHVRCHEKYGSVYRSGPNRVVFNTLSAANVIYSTDRTIRKGDGYTSHPWTRQAIPSLFNCVDPAWVSRKKKTIRPATAQPALDLHHASVEDNVEVLVDMFRNGQAQDLSEVGFHFALDVISQSMFGEKFQTMQDSTNRWMTISLERGNRHMYLQLAWPGLFHVLGYFIHPELLSYPQFFKESKMFLELCERCLALGSAKEKKSIFQLMKAELPDDVSDEELHVDAYSFMRGGGDMVAVTIAATFFYLQQNPRTLQKLRDEIGAAFGSSVPRIGTLLESCTYLRACVDEALRMAPPGPGVFWRTSSRDQVIDGILLPAGTEFGVSIYALHYNADVFPEPKTFRPERMMKATHEGGSSAARDGLMPFLRGLRACPAQKLAYASILLPVARLVWEFELNDVDCNAGLTDEPGVFPQVDVFGSHISGPVVSFHARGHGQTQA